MDTRTRGDVAEAALLQAFSAAGLIVSKPGRLRGGCVESNCVGTDHGRGVGSYRGRADVLAVHVHATGEQYVVPVAEAMAAKMLLRLEPTRNNQVTGVRFASDYRLSDWLTSATSAPTHTVRA